MQVDKMTGTRNCLFTIVINFSARQQCGNYLSLYNFSSAVFLVAHAENTLIRTHMRSP